MAREGSAARATGAGHRWTVAAWALAALSLTFAALWATAPVSVNSTRFEWKPADALQRSTPLVLAAPTPAQLKVSVPCDRATQGLLAGATRQVLRTTSGPNVGDSLALVVQPGAAWAEFQGKQVPGSAISIGAGCTLSMDYSRDAPGGSLRVSAGFGASVSEPTYEKVEGKNLVRRLPTVTGLSADPAVVPGLTATVLTDTTSVEPPAWRIGLGFLLVGAAAGTLVCVGMAMRSRRAPGPAAGIPPDVQAPRGPSVAPHGGALHRPSPRWTASDTVVALVAAAAVFLIPPEFDDGWVLTTVRGFSDLGEFSNYYTVQAVAQPQGYWWTWLSRLWLDPTGVPAFAYRLPAVMLVFGAWWLIRRWVLDQVLPLEDLRRARFAGALAMVVALLGLLVTIRPEPLEAALVAIVIAASVALWHHPRFLPVAVIWSVAALGFAAHQTGWSVVAAAVATLPATWRWMRTLPRSERWLPIAAGVAVASLAVWLLLLGTNARQWFEAAREFTATGTGYQSPFNEAIRLQNLVDGFGSVPARWVFVGLGLVALLGFLSRSEAQRTPAVSAAGWPAAAALAGLLLTASKFTIHWGAVGLAVVVLVALAAADLVHHPRPAVRASVGGAAIVLAAAAGSRPVQVMTPGTQEVPGFVASGWLPTGSLLWWVALVLVALLVGRRLAVRRRLGGSGWALASTGVLGVLVVATVGWIALVPMLAVASDPVSWPGQQVAALRGAPCGLTGDEGIRVPTETAKLVFAASSADSAPQTLSDKGVNGEPAPLPGLTVVSPTSAQGQSATAWFAVPDQGPVAFWMQGRLGTIVATVEFQDQAGSPLPPRVIERMAEQSRWSAVQTSPPEGAARVRIVWNAQGGPLSVTDPVAVTRSASLEQLAAGEPVWNNPGTHLQAPCPQMPSIADGVISPFNWSVGGPQWNGMGYVNEVWSVEMACPAEQLEASFRCAYRFDQPAPSSALTREVISHSG